MMTHAAARATLLVHVSLVLGSFVGCGTSEPAGTAPPSGVGGGSAACPPQHVVIGPNGACTPVGIQGCAELFVEADGLCHPRMEKCPLGTIPKFDEGCVPVGIQGCAEVFMQDDGLCHPTMAKCPAGTFAIPLDGCIPLDGPLGCGDGPWGHIPAGPDTMWVDGTYAGGDGDGTPNKPFVTIAAALAAVPSGGRVALAAGTYDEPVKLTRPVELVGRCPSLVTISGVQSAYSVPSIVWADYVDDVLIRNLRISGAGVGLSVVHASVSVEGVHIFEAAGSGIMAAFADSQVILDRTLIEGTRPSPGSQVSGKGLVVQSAARADLAASAVVANHDVGIFASNGNTTVTVTNSLVAGTLPQQSDQLFGLGVWVQGRAHATLSASAVVGNHTAGVLAMDNDTEVSVLDSLIAGTLPQQESQTHGEGLYVQIGARATVASSAVLGNHEAGILAFGEDGEDPVITEVTVAHSLVRGTLPRPSDQRGGRGLALEELAHGIVESSAIVANHEVGVAVLNPGTELSATGTLVEGTLPRLSDQKFGMGVWQQKGSQATLTSCAVVRNHASGVALVHSDAGLTVTATLVESTQPQLSDGAYGMGVMCGIGALTLSESVVRDSRVAAVSAWRCDASVGGSLLEDVFEGYFYNVDEDGVPVDHFYDVGDGLLASYEASMAVTNTLVRGCVRAGLIFDASGGSLEHVVSTGNRFGLSLQGTPQPTVDHTTCSFADNTEKDILGDGNLPVPNAPPEMPQVP